MFYHKHILLWIINIVFVRVNGLPIFDSNEFDNENITTISNKTYSVAFFRPTWMEIHLDAIRSNVQKLKAYIGNDVLLMAVVKGDAYGFGAIEVSEIAISAGANWLGVATLDEALLLRLKLSRYVPILVLGYVSPAHLKIASRHRVTVTAVSLAWIKEADAIAQQPFDFHLKVDTGMNRLGCKSVGEIQSVIKIVSKNQYMNWKGVFTHFATSEDVKNKSYFHYQLNLFNKFLEVIPEQNNKIIHCANSGATLLQRDKVFYNMVRVGSGLTGALSEKTKHFQPFQLEEATVSLRSTIDCVKKLNAGEKIGYDIIYTTKRKQWIGTVPIGYNDGWHDSLKSNTVLVDGKRVPIVGKVAMDQMQIALPKKYEVGTRVTLFGRDGDESILLTEIEDASKLDKFELLPTFSVRIPRIYFLDKSIISVKNKLLESVTLL